MGSSKLLKYQDFNSRFQQAEVNGDFGTFIQELQILIDKHLNIYLATLFIARCYVSIKNFEEAKKHYDQAFKLAKDPNWLNDEIKNFSNRYLPATSTVKFTLSDAEAHFKKVQKWEASDNKLVEFDTIYNESSLRAENFIYQYIMLLQKLKHYNKVQKLLDEILETATTQEQQSHYLLIKAQMSSANDEYHLAVETYLKLIEINKRLNVKNSNLGHLYFEIARIYIKLNNLDKALSSAEQAYDYTPTTSIINFINSIKDANFKGVDDDDFTIEISDEQIDFISPMLKFDIEEFDYRDNVIVKNGKTSKEDAERIYTKAKNNITKDLSLVYPIYLEAAKAYNDLKSGSYNYENFIDALAKYSAHKSNAIFYIYRLELNSSKPDFSKLKRLKDSACSYIEASINLENDPPKLLFLLSNYLKVTISYLLFNEGNSNYKYILNLKYFNQIITYCTKHKNQTVILQTQQAVIHFGSVSIRIWDRISRLSKDTEDFYEYLKTLRSPLAKKNLVHILSTHENIKVDHNLPIAKIFYQFIINRKKQKELFEINFSILRGIAFNPMNITSIDDKWKQIKLDNKLFSETDIEISHAVDSILKNYKPYLDRTIPERTNILFQVRTAIETQLRFIVENTTYWGRAMFFPLLKKWKTDINKLERERVSQTTPILSPIIDPSFIFKKEDEYVINLVIKNIGQATASAFILNLDALHLDGRIINQIQTRIEKEITVNGSVPLEIGLSEDLVTAEKAIKLHVNINPIYQEKELIQPPTEFTLEKEAKSFLQVEDIPWNETKIPKQHLFKGREKLIRLLSSHYKSVNKDKTYILYGLTRTGKSSVLRYLEKEIENQNVKVDGIEKKVITFFWDLSEASGQSNAQDMWAFLLYDNTISKIENLVEKGLISKEVCPQINTKPRFKDWKKIIEHLNSSNYYPIFLVDEFAYYKLLHDNGRLDQSFLAAIRQYALSGIASFIFAGTYDLKELIKNPQYGITGQLTNTIERLISNIDNVYARELIDVIKDKLEFTDEAIAHILFLSGRVPYFIQIICKYCGYFAVENSRKVLGSPEVESVVKILIGEERSQNEDSLITILSAGTFQNNQYSPTDNKEIQSLISSICYKNRHKTKPRGVSYAELQELWSSREITGFAPKLAEAIAYLRDKEIIEEISDEMTAAYMIKVDLFRRWWENQHRDIDLELDILKEK